MGVLTDLKNRGVADVFFVVCDGLKGRPDSVNMVFPATIVQACVIHLIRATLRYASRKYWDHLARDLRAIYTAPNAKAAWSAFEELERGSPLGRCGANRTRRSPSSGVPPGGSHALHGQSSPRSWTTTSRSGESCSLPTQESLNARYRRTVTARGHFPYEQAALKCLYLVTRGLDPKGTGQARWTLRWKPALNAFARHLR